MPRTTLEIKPPPDPATVLLVDDDPAILDGVGEFLGEQGFRVVGGSTGGGGGSRDGGAGNVGTDGGPRGTAAAASGCACSVEVASGELTSGLFATALMVALGLGTRRRRKR
jgi:MYXO-CTERM domain-containing protein